MIKLIFSITTVVLSVTFSYSQSGRCLKLNDVELICGNGWEHGEKDKIHGETPLKVNINRGSALLATGNSSDPYDYIFTLVRSDNFNALYVGNLGELISYGTGFKEVFPDYSVIDCTSESSVRVKTFIKEIGNGNDTFVPVDFCLDFDIVCP